MNKTLATLPPTNGAIYLDNRPTAPPRLTILDVYAESGMARDDELRLDALATISAGLRAPAANGRAGLPQRSKTIQLHDEAGRAPALKRALEATQGRSLTIAFPFDDPNHFIQQGFVEYSQTRLLAYGDANGITVVSAVPDSPTRLWCPAGTPEFQAAKARCKVATNVYFCLAEWDNGNPAMVWDDGLGFYRLRFTSRNSLHALRAKIMEIQAFTGGRIAGLPLELSLGTRDVASPTGERRSVPVWQLLFKPPAGIRVTSRTFRDIAEAGLTQGATMLMLPASQTFETASKEAPEPDLDEITMDAEVTALAQPPKCDAEHWRKQWFATVESTHLDNDQERADFLYWWTGCGSDGLAFILQAATEEDAQRLMNAVQDELTRATYSRARYEELAVKATAEGVKTSGGRDWADLSKVRPEVARDGLARIRKALADANAATPPAEPPTPFAGAQTAAQAQRDATREPEDGDPFAQLPAQPGDALIFPIPPNTPQTACKGCGATICYVPTGNTKADGSPVMMPVNAATGQSHFQTCPNANDFSHKNAAAPEIPEAEIIEEAAHESEPAEHTLALLRESHAAGVGDGVNTAHPELIKFINGLRTTAGKIAIEDVATLDKKASMKLAQFFVNAQTKAVQSSE